MKLQDGMSFEEIISCLNLVPSKGRVVCIEDGVKFRLMNKSECISLELEFEVADNGGSYYRSSVNDNLYYFPGNAIVSWLEDPNMDEEDVGPAVCSLSPGNDFVTRSPTCVSDNEELALSREYEDAEEESDEGSDYEERQPEDRSRSEDKPIRTPRRTDVEYTVVSRCIGKVKDGDKSLSVRMYGQPAEVETFNRSLWG